MDMSGLIVSGCVGNKEAVQDPWELLVHYMVPSRGYRGYVLRVNLGLGNVIKSSSLDLERPYNYPFMRSIDLIKGNRYIHEPLFFFYDRLEDSY